MCIIVFITAKDQAEGQLISDKLLQERLAACVNIIEGVKSCFWWEGKIDSSSEVLLVVKTQKKLFARLQKCVKTHHSYTVPEIIAFPIVEGNPEYLKWIKDSTK
jgi:periplasmic divalent cation tolerance protein